MMETFVMRKLFWCFVVVIFCVINYVACGKVERKQNSDIFEIKKSDCNYRINAFHTSSGLCECRHGLIFVGNTCVEFPATECREYVTNILPDIEVEDIDKILVKDSDGKKSFWNDAYSKNIKTLIEMEDTSLDEKLTILEGLILKVTKSNGGCTIIRLLGESQYPVVLNNLPTTTDTSTKTTIKTETTITESPESSISASTTSSANSPTTSSTSTVDMEDSTSGSSTVLNHQGRNTPSEDKGTSFTMESILIVVIAATLTIILVVTTILLIRRRNMKRNRNGSKTIETPFGPDGSECSGPSDPGFASPALSRQSFDTVTTTAGEYAHDEIIYEVPDDILSEASYQHNLPVTKRPISAEYGQEPEYYELEPDYAELEPEEADNIKQMNLINKPVLPRKPTALRVNSSYINEGLESEEDYYSEAIQPPVHSARQNIEELYAKVDKSRI